ncbi:cadherin-like domain-containing protein [Candidatus Desantisbacteria bacterium]|nr:cadherin-like domain-containing protein [Candidatus Desantisbacteria bacterium]
MLFKKFLITLLFLLIIIFPIINYAGTVYIDEIITSNPANATVKFFYYLPDKILKINSKANVLVCVGGLDSSGDQFMTDTWKNFADKVGYIILAPYFRFNNDDWLNGTSYQYPYSWSGEALINMLDKINTTTPYQLYMFGFSAGAQFVHRFALLYPEITIAVHAHAAGEYTYPQKKINTHFLISVGQNDTDRLPKAQNFYDQCVYLKIRAELIIYPNLGHALTQKQIDDGQNFLIPNQPPIANNDSKVVKGTAQTIIDVLANDIDPDGDKISIKEVANGANGTVMNNGDGTVTYTANSNLKGIDSFLYIIADEEDSYDTGIVNITIVPVVPGNNDPVANDDFVPIDYDTSVIIDLLENDTDIDGDLLTVIEVAESTNGMVINNGGWNNNLYSGD